MSQNHLDKMLSTLTPRIFQNLVSAVETGKWADGVALTEKQKEDALQLIMLWQSRNNTEADHMTINTKGEMVLESKKEMKLKFNAQKIDVINKD